MPIVFYDNEWIDESMPLLRADDRSLRYGDGLFESMVAFEGAVALLPYHYERLRRSCEILLMELPGPFDFDRLKATIAELLAKNRYTNARLRLQVSRRGGGLYLPDSNEVDVLISCAEISHRSYQWHSIRAEFSPYRVDTGVLSNLKTTSKIQYVMSALHAQKVGAQECFLFNTKGTLAEAISSNVFLVRGDMIMTPALTNGGVNGVMRRFLIGQLEQRYRVVQSDVLMKDIDEADEIFLTNAVRGIQSVAVVGSTVYSDTLTRDIHSQLNEAIQHITTDVGRG
jgi:branched-chain amino acid aminotransferase